MKIVWLLLLLVVAAFDFSKRKVKNEVIVLMILFGVFFMAIGKNLFEVNWQEGVLGAFFCFLFFLIFYRMKLMGAGDVKFATVLGLWMGLSNGLIIVFLGATLLAMLHAFFEIFVLQKTNIAIEKENIRNIFNTKEKNKSIPYAGYMAIAAIVWMLSGLKTAHLLSV